MEESLDALLGSGPRQCPKDNILRCRMNSATSSETSPSLVGTSEQVIVP